MKDRRWEWIVPLLVVVLALGLFGGLVAWATDGNHPTRLTRAEQRLDKIDQRLDRIEKQLKDCTRTTTVSKDFKTITTKTVCK